MLDGKRPRLEHEQSTTSSTSLGSGTEQEAPCNNVDDRHRRVGSTSSAGPYSSVARHPSPTSIHSRSTLPVGSMASVLPVAAGSPMSTSSSSPSIRRDSSLGPPRPSVELYSDRLAFSIGSQQHLHRILPNDLRATSANNSSTISTDSRLLHARRSPLCSADSIPTLMHQASDSSNPSITSTQSSTSTAASSTCAPRSLEDDSQAHVILPPLPTVSQKSLGTSSLTDCVSQPNLSSPYGSSTSRSAGQQASQPPFPTSSGTDIDSLELPLPHKIFFGQKPEPWPKKGAKLANIFDLQDIPGAGDRHALRNLSLQPSTGSELRIDALEPAYSPEPRLPSLRQTSSRSVGPDASPPSNLDPLSVLADAAYADRDSGSAS